MAAAYSGDLRQRVMADVAAGMSAEAAAVKYSVTARTIYHWKVLRDQTGALQPRRGRTGRTSKLEPFRDSIGAALREKPGLTLEELQARFQLPCSLTAVWRALRRWGLVLKKKS